MKVEGLRIIYAVTSVKRIMAEGERLSVICPNVQFRWSSEAVAKRGRFITMELKHANRHALQYCVDLLYARIDKYGNDIS